MQYPPHRIEPRPFPDDPVPLRHREIDDRRRRSLAQRAVVEHARQARPQLFKLLDADAVRLPAHVRRCERDRVGQRRAERVYKPVQRDANADDGTVRNFALRRDERVEVGFRGEDERDGAGQESIDERPG